MRYINCTIRILSENQVRYEEEGLDEKEREIGGSIVLDELQLNTIARLNYWINYAVARQANNPVEALACTLDDLKTLGLHLYRLLFSDEAIRTPFERAFDHVEARSAKEPDLRLRLRLVFEPGVEKKLAALPWEFMLVARKNYLDTGLFMAGQRTELLLTRKLQLPDLLGTLSPQNTLRVLLVTCEPDVIDGVELPTVDTKEIDEIKKTILGIGGTTGRVTVKILTDPWYDQMKKTLKTYQPQIVHYVGHGAEEKLALGKNEKEDDWDIEGAKKQFRWITAKQVKALFSDPPRPHLVFLNACKGASSEMVESFRSTARELVYAGIPGVVAMQYSISNAHARLFAKRFYEEIGLGKDIDEAVKMGRKALGEIFPPWEHPRFATPVVYLQSTERLINPTESEAAEEEPPRESSRLSPRGSQVIGSDKTPAAQSPAGQRHQAGRTAAPRRSGSIS